jgi:hypothetical protein
MKKRQMLLFTLLVLARSCMPCSELDPTLPLLLVSWDDLLAIPQPRIGKLSVMYSGTSLIPGTSLSPTRLARTNLKHSVMLNMLLVTQACVAWSADMLSFSGEELSAGNQKGSPQLP